MEMTRPEPRIECHMRTFTGKIVNPLNLQRADVHIDDIAHHLACITRFNGALREPISIAQHSVTVYQLVQHFTPDAATRKLALLHDASEAYLGDVTKWLKASDAMKGYREAEFLAMVAIGRAFDLPYIESEHVTRADKLAVRYEAYLSGFNLQAPGYGALTDAELKMLAQVVFPTRILPWREAKQHFMGAYYDVF